MRTSAEELQQITLPGWVAEQQPLGDWTLRAGGGFTGRANSCLAVGDPGLPVAEAAERVVEFSQAHQIPPWAQVIDDSEPERRLRALGWTDVYVPTDVLVTRLTDLLADHRPDPRVQLTETLTPQWLAAYQRSRPNSADPEVLRRILESEPPRAFAGVADDGRLVAIGRGHLATDWLGLASIWTDPAWRRQGWAMRIMTALGHWAARHGARNVYLQVAAENGPAHQAYERIGFSRHHGYRYLQAPDRRQSTTSW
jgi:GNAT superfamily N-acetyltransferase